MSEDPPLILIADDSQLSREFMANELRAAGYDVIQAIDGGSALKVIHEHPVAMAIIDHFMSPHGGFDFAKQVRIGKIDVPMIMITNEETSDLLIETTRHGISKYLRKPVEPKRLIETVQRTLRETTVHSQSPVTTTVDLRYGPNELMARAIDLALRNVQSRHGGPFGAVVASAEGRILGEGVNGITSRCDPMAHAEVMAIRQATERLNQTHLEGCTLYCSSKPTTIGKALIESVGIAKVFYGLSHADVNQIRSPQQRQTATYERLGYEEALAMFQQFQQLPKPTFND